jgi:molecular chaperone HscA
MVVVTDTQNQLVLGLDPGTGDQKWSIPTLTDQYKDKPKTIPVLAPADLKAPTQLDGTPVGGYSDGRLVQLGGDASARVIDSHDGHISKSKGNIGDYQSLALAYNGRLYVASSTGAHTVTSYDLAGLDQPRTTYQPGNATHTIMGLAPCGTAICALDVTKGDDKTDRVYALDPAGNDKRVWQADAPNTTLMVPFGDGALVQDTHSGEETTMLLGPGGKDRMRGSGKTYVAVRLTTGSAVLLSGSQSTAPVDLFLAGFGMHTGAVSSIGKAAQVRSQGCSWTTTLLVCPGDKSFTIWRFAS